jgi:hypothetical protein
VRSRPSALRDFTVDHRVWLLTGVTIFIGAGAAALAVVLLRAIVLATNAFYYHRLSLAMVGPAGSTLSPWIMPLVPIIGGLMVGLIAHYGSDKIRGHGIPEAIEAILLRGARVDPKVAVLKPLSAAIAIGKPNEDGTIGSCTECHSRHTSSVALARLPTTCGQCHMGPDHSQMEIYNESKHGVMFAAQRNLLNLNADPRTLTTRDMFVPTCATCHMSGINGLKVTHNPSDRLGWYLADAVTTHRPNYLQAQIKMKQVCTQCHTQALVDRVYTQGEQVIDSTNAKVLAAKDIMDGLHKNGSLAGPPFTHLIDFTYFNLWHYDGRTSKHGAFMGGADFVQWHGNYELLSKTVEIQHDADELRREHAHK